MKKFLLILIAALGGYVLAWYTKPAEEQKELWPWGNSGNAVSFWSQLISLFQEKGEDFRFSVPEDSLKYLQAIEYYEQENYLLADSIFSDLSMYNEFDSIFIYAARAKTQLGKTEDVQYFYLRAIELTKDNAKLYAEYAHYLNTQFLIYDADYYAEEALNIDPYLVEAFYELAYSYNFSGYYDLAVEKLDEGMALDSSYAPFYYLKALIFEQKNDFDNAAANYSLAIQYNPEFEDAIGALAYLNFKFGYHYEAIKWYQKAIENKSKRKYLYYQNAALAFTKIEKPDSAFSYYAESIKLKPDNPDVYKLRGYLYYQLNRYNAAIADYNMAVDLKDNTAELFIYRGSAYYENEMFIEALNDFYSAFEAEPLNEHAIYNLAITHDKLSNNSDALEMYQKYLQFGTDSTLLDYSSKRVSELSQIIN